MTKVIVIIRIVIKVIHFQVAILTTANHRVLNRRGLDGALQNPPTPLVRKKNECSMTSPSQTTKPTNKNQHNTPPHDPSKTRQYEAGREGPTHVSRQDKRKTRQGKARRGKANKRQGKKARQNELRRETRRVKRGQNN
jgi:hypothetical protein